MALTEANDPEKEPLVNDRVHVRMVKTKIGRTVVAVGFEPDDIEIVPEEVALYSATQRDKEIISSSRRHMVDARLLPMPDVDADDKNVFSRWKNWRESIVSDTEGLRSCEEILHFAQARVPFDCREPWNDSFESLHHLVINEFPWIDDKVNLFKFGDNPKSLPNTIKAVDGVLRSNILCWHLRSLCFCLHYARASKYILEIGGGYGALARLWLKLGYIRRYVIVDIPESLFFAEVALRDELGDDKIGYWEGKDPGTQLVLLPIERLAEYTDAVDLVINVGSMQEMSEPWIDFYMRWLDRSGANFFYSMNYMGQPSDEMYESRTYWGPRPTPNRWVTKVLNADIPLIKGMGFNRSFGDGFYERGAPDRKFSEWTVLRGEYLNRATYLAGLELLRQDFTLANAELFISTILASKHHFKFAKEMIYICRVLSMSGVTKHDALLERLLKTGRMTL